MRIHTTRIHTTLGPAAAFLCLLLSTHAQASPPNTSGTQNNSAEASSPIDINGATEADFVRLPNLGPSRAAAIVKLRTKLGGFTRIEQLMRVRGIGRRTFQKLRPMLSVKSGKSGHTPAHGRAKTK